MTSYAATSAPSTVVVHVRSPLSVSARSSTETPNGVVVGDEAEASLIPAALLAVTVKV